MSTATSEKPAAKKPTLPFVTPPSGDEQKYLNVVLYGDDGIGKTAQALGAPGPVLYLNAEGPNAAAFARKLHGDDHIREVVIETKADLDAAYMYLKDGGDGEQSVVLDSLGEIRSRVMRSMAGNPDRPQLQEIGDANTAVINILKAFRDLPFNVVVVCHERLIEDSEGVLRVPHAGTKNADVLKQITGLFADVVGYCGRVDEDGRPPQFFAQVVNGNGRTGKDRTARLGVAAPIDIPEWVALWNAPLPSSTNNEES